jgi:small subunit ribosomal protein S3
LGRKVHPYGFRLGVIRDWRAHWYAEGQEYADLLHEDLMIREHIDRELHRAGISRIEIERFPNQVTITIFTARPGIVIGRKGASVKMLRHTLEQRTGKRVSVDIQEVAQPRLDAKLVAEDVAGQLERRISHHRAMSRAVRGAMEAGAEGVKVMCRGRLYGAEMARVQWQQEGSVPRQTLRADIDFGQAEARTTYGRIGVRAWIYKGEVLPEVREEARAEPFVV